MPKVISEPEYEGFDGTYVGDKKGTSLPPNEIDFSKIIPYMKNSNKDFSDLTPEEIERFKFKAARI